MKSKFFAILTAMFLLTFAVTTSSTQAQVKLTGAGSTFDYPIFSKWFDLYNKMTGVQINYASIGSGGGIRQITEGTVDFGASDAPLTTAQRDAFKKARGSEVLHIPIIIGGEAITYNLPTVGSGLVIDGTTLADIYLGKISKWNDPALVKLNPGKKLPNLAILVCHRSDGSGTSFIFTNYLSKVSPEWAKKVGFSTAVNWPVGLGGKGNEGVSGLVAQTKGAIGYVELAYAITNKLPYAKMKNREGSVVPVNFNTVTAAAAGASKHMPADLCPLITNSPGKNSFPIAGFSWVVVPRKISNKTKADALIKFLKWAVTKGQSYAEQLYYSPLPKSVQELDLKQIDKINN